MIDNTNWAPKPNTWTYQLVKCADCLVIAEVFYNKYAQPTGYCSRTLTEYFDDESTTNDLRNRLLETLERMSRVAEKPILNADSDFCGFSDDEEGNDV